MAKPWQQSLLSSGLPLEADLLAYLQARGCIGGFEYSYLKPDELRIEREFSYDVDASYIKRNNFFDLMVECKYRHPGARWVFAPDEYGGPDELSPNDFLHPLDAFTKIKFPYGDLFPRQLAPLCSKGVEILGDGSNEKTVTQALNQLAYAFAPKLASAIEHQVDKLLGRVDHIFYSVPIIATTAEIYRLRSGVRIASIRSADTIEDVADRLPCVVMKYNTGAELKRYNIGVFNEHIARLGEKKLSSAFDTFTKSLSHYYTLLASRSPRAVVFVTVDEQQLGLNRVFDYIDELVEPSPALMSEISAREAQLAELVAQLPIPKNWKSRRK